MIRFPAALLLLLAASIALACEPRADDPLSCITGSWAVFLPKAQGEAAPNVLLKRFVHQSPDDRFGQGIAHEELMRLHAQVKPMSAAAFSASRTSFDVVVRYTLTPDKPAAFDMHTNGKEAEKTQLTAFYNQAATLKDFHSKTGTVHVVFHYSVSPAANASGASNQ